jgi:hypothetical protein
MEDVLRIAITSSTNWRELHEDILRQYDSVLHTEIWLDFSTESWFSIDNQKINETVYEFIHNTIRNTGLDWDLFTFIHGNVYTQYNYSLWREIFNITEEIKTSYYPLWHKMTADMHLNFSYQNEQHKDTIRPFLFSCLNGAPRDHRIKTEKFVKENNLLDKSRYTFYWSDDVLPYSNLTSDWRKWPNLEEHNKHRAIQSHRIQEPEFYKVFDDTYFDFITETLTTNERFGIELEKYVDKPPTPQYKKFFQQFKTIFITEKLWRSIFYKRPFIVMGNHRTLEYLQSLGFKTFDGMWNEDYDEIFDPNDREKACLELLKEVCDTYTLESMHNKVYSEEIQEILQHNYDLFLKLAGEISDLTF